MDQFKSQLMMSKRSLRYGFQAKKSKVIHFNLKKINKENLVQALGAITFLLISAINIMKIHAFLFRSSIA